jgi:phosphinothricin acetyltransferase
MLFVMIVRPMRPSDQQSVLDIYEEGLATKLATFETTVPTWEEWDVTYLRSPRFVATAGVMTGWAALSPASSRSVYRGVAENSVYVGETHRGQGVGKALLAALVSASEDLGYSTLQASMFPENENSIKLHQAFGFRIIGRREQIAQLDGVWRDTLLMERRSDLKEPLT